jgi:WD40 repeat protein
MLCLCRYGILSVSLLIWVGIASGAEPTAEQVAEQKKAFEAERKLALEQKFTEQGLSRADDLASKAQKYLDKKNYREAFKQLREARWQVPYLPPDLPKHVTRVFGQTRMRHGDWVNSVSIDPTGTLVVSGSRDGTVKIWNLANGREVRTYRGHKTNVPAVAWSADGKWIASAGGQEIHLWNPENGERKQVLKGNEKEINSLTFRPDSKALAAAGEDQIIRIYDVEKGEELFKFDKQNSRIHQIAYSPNGKMLAAVNNDGMMGIWNPDPAKEAKRLFHNSSEHSGGAIAVVFDFDGKSLFTGGGDRVARKLGAPGPNGEYIERVTGSRIKEFNAAGGGHTDKITALVVSPDGKTLITGGEDNTIRIWDVSSGKVIRVLQGHQGFINSLTLSRDGQTLVSASRDHTIRVWLLDLNDTHRSLNDHTASVWSAVYSPDGTLAASAGADRKIRIWNTETGAITAELPGHSIAVTALAFNRDGTQLISCGGDQLVKLWSIAEKKLLKEYKGHTSPVMAVVMSSDNKQILSGSADKSAILWNLETTEAVHTFKDLRAPVGAVAIRSDNKQALIGTADGMLRVFDLSGTPQELLSSSVHLSGVASLGYSPDGKRIVTGGGDRLVKVWNLDSEKKALALASELRGHTQPLSSVSYSPDGKYIASAGGDMVVRLWNASTLLELRALRGHTEWVASVAFSNDSKALISAGVDKTVRMWELTQEETVSSIGHTLPIRAVAIDKSGKWLASGSDDRTIKIWNLESGYLESTLSGHADEVTAVAFDPKEDRLTSGSKDSKILTWDLKGKKVISTLNADPVAMLLYTVNGDKLLSWMQRPGTGNEVANIAQVYDRTGMGVSQFAERARYVACLSFSLDGEITAYGSKDGVVRLWNLNKNEKLGADLPVSQKNVGDLVFTPDKTKLITGDMDSEVKVWDLAKREAIKTFQAHNLPLYTVVMSPDGKKFATVAENEIKVWDLQEYKELRSWTLPSAIKNLVFSPDGKSLVSANGDTTLYLLQLP